MEHEATSVNSFDDWYTHREVVDFGTRRGCLDFKGLTSLASGGLMNCVADDAAAGWQAVNLAMIPMLAAAGAGLIWLRLREARPARL